MIDRGVPSRARDIRVALIGAATVLVVPIILWLATSAGESNMVDQGEAMDVEVDSQGEGELLDESLLEGEDPSLWEEEEALVRRFVGRIDPGRSMAGISPLDGIINSIDLPDFGVLVEKGDVLITLRPSSQLEKSLRESKIALIEAKRELLRLQNWWSSAEMRNAERSVKEAEYELKKMKLEHDRTKQLFDEGIVAENEYEAILDSLRSARSQQEIAIAQREETAEQAKGELLTIANERLDIAELDYQELREQEGKREIRAPMSGILLPVPSSDYNTRDFTVGQEVKKGTPLFLVGSLDELVIKISISEFDIDLIAVGQEATVTSPTQDDFVAYGEVTGISQISSSFIEGMGPAGAYTPPLSRYDASISISTEDQDIAGTIRVGMVVDVEIDTSLNVASDQ